MTKKQNRALIVALAIWAVAATVSLVLREWLYFDRYMVGVGIAMKLAAPLTDEQLAQIQKEVERQFADEDVDVLLYFPLTTEGGIIMHPDKPGPRARDQLVLRVTTWSPNAAVAFWGHRIPWPARKKIDAILERAGVKTVDSLHRIPSD